MATAAPNCSRALAAIIATILTLVVAGLAASPASAGSTCPQRTLTQPFKLWSDLAYYFLAPNGGFENGTTGWTLSRGASIVDGNEPWYVTARGDTHSLSLAGATAASGSICIEHIDRSIRLFARGSAGTTLKIEIGYPGAKGTVSYQQVALVAGLGSWEVTPVLLLPPSLATSDSTSSLWIRFTNTDRYASWLVDDIYVDPFVNE